MRKKKKKDWHGDDCVLSTKIRGYPLSNSGGTERARRV
jgi:hypothetical protein